MYKRLRDLGIIDKTDFIKIIPKGDSYIQDVNNDAILTGDEFWALVKKTACYLRDKNKIFLFAVNSYRWLAVYWGCFFAGKKLYIFDINYHEEIIREALLNEKADVVFVESCFVNRFDDGNHISIDKLDEVVSQYSLADFSVSEEEFESVVYTTGSTGVPKGVVLSETNVMASVMTMQERMGFTQDDAYYIPIPLSHVMGCGTMATAICSGATIVLGNGEPLPLKETVAPITISILPPALMITMRNNKRFISFLKSMRYMITGGATFAKVYYDYYRDKGIKIFFGYGASECTCAVACTDFSKGGFGGRLFPLDMVEIEISQKGEILISSEIVAKCYIDGKPIPDEDGRYHTHDCGELCDGELKILGRMDNVVVLRNGYKILPEAIEERISKSPRIEDCIVFVRTEKDRNVISAEVVLNEKYRNMTAQEVINEINKDLAVYEKISYVEICSELKTIRGKKNRHDR